MPILLREIDERGVLTLTLNRPEIHNAFDPELIATLTTELEKAGENQSVRTVILTGTGTSFSAGADINWMRGMKDATEQENEQDALRLARLMRTLNFLARPTVAAINGPAFGGGLGLIACCDITISVDTASFGLTESTLGLVPAVISPYVLRRIGEGNARRYFMTGERFSAQMAKEMGLVQQVVAPESLGDSVGRIISSLGKTAPGAALVSKRLAYSVAGHDEARQLEIDEYNAKLIAQARVSREGQEGLSAFLERRKPDWSRAPED